MSNSNQPKQEEARRRLSQSETTFAERVEAFERAQDWLLSGALIWIRDDGQRVTDQAVDAVRRGVA